MAGFSLSLTLAVAFFLSNGSFSGISTFPFWSGPGASLRLALPATTEEGDPVMRDGETGAGFHAS